jgi:hypothetical protein
VYVASVIVNLALLVAAVALVTYGSSWLERHPWLAKRVVADNMVERVRGGSTRRS